LSWDAALGCRRTTTASADARCRPPAGASRTNIVEIREGARPAPRRGASQCATLFVLCSYAQQPGRGRARGEPGPAAERAARLCET
jgi:hypothetical protein